jgi:hypothetical protein
MGLDGVRRKGREGAARSRPGPGPAAGVRPGVVVEQPKQLALSRLRMPTTLWRRRGRALSPTWGQAKPTQDLFTFQKLPKKF